MEKLSKNFYGEAQSVEGNVKEDIHQEVKQLLISFHKVKKHVFNI